VLNIFKVELMKLLYKYFKNRRRNFTNAVGIELDTKRCELMNMILYLKAIMKYYKIAFPENVLNVETNTMIK
jgi:hypothetical protein